MTLFKAAKPNYGSDWKNNSLDKRSQELNKLIGTEIKHESGLMVERIIELLHLKIPDSLELNLTGQHVPPHPPVAEKAEPGIREGGRLVMLKEKMSGPGKGIALYKGQCNEPPHRSNESCDEQHQDYGCASEVQPAGNPVGVFAEVKRIKLFKRMVKLCFIHDDAFNLALCPI